jgi:rod shape-determining protein MreD
LNKKILSLNIILLIILFALQFTVVPLISFGAISPNLPLIFVVYHSFRLKKTSALLLGFFVGILIDLINGGVVGASAFAMTVAAYVVTFIPPGFIDKEQFSIRFLLILFLSAAAYSFLYNVLDGEVLVNIFYGIFYFGILPAFYTTALSVPLLFLNSEGILNE